MPQHPPAPDETVRMRSDGPSGRPTLEGPRTTTTGSPAGQTPVHAQGSAQSSAPRPEQGPAEPEGESEGEGEAEPEGEGAVELEVGASPDAARGPAAAAAPGDVEFDDTRPVSRDWLRKAPETGHDAAPQERPADDATSAAAPEPIAGPDDTQQFAPAASHATTPVGTLPGDPPASPDDAGGSPWTRGGSDADGPHAPGGAPPGDAPPPGDGRGAWWRRKAVLVPAATVGVLAAAYGADLLVSSGEIPRNTVVAGIEIGGLSPADAATQLEERLAPRVVADHPIVAADVEATLSPATAGIQLDVDGTVDAAAGQPLNPWTRLVTLFGDRTVEPEITGDETALAAQIDTIAEQVDRAPVDATIALENTTPTLVEPAEGRTLDRDGAAEAITDALSSGGDPATPIELPVDVQPVRVDTEEAQRVLDEVVTPAVSAPVTVTSADGATSAEVPVAAIAAGLTFTPQDSGELAVAIDPTALQAALGDTLGVFGTPAQDARFDVSGETVSIVPSVDGTGVDPALLADQLLGVLTEPAPRTVTAELGPVPAEFTTQEAEALGIREKISSFTTNFTNASSGTNIRVVAEEVDGALVLPGETFSLNGYTGPRGIAQGYVEAGVINNGEFTTAVGGGISQFATTMFNAVFFAGLEDVYHKPHSYYISRYPAGREATVYYDSIDLTWRNDTDTGVYVDTAWVPGAITVTFYGTRYYEIDSISSERYNFRSPVVQEKVDDGECAPQSGSTGFDITVTRVFRDATTGAEIRREDFFTRYAAEPVIRCVPPPAPAPGEESTPPAGQSAPGG